MLWLGLFRGLLFSSDLDIGEAELSNEFDQDADAYEDVENGEDLDWGALDDEMRIGDARRRQRRDGEVETVHQAPMILKISSSYSPPPPEGFVSPMTWGVEDNVIERFAAAGVPEGKISFERATYTFNFAGSASELVAEFRAYYGPTMNAFEAAAANGREAELHSELDALFNSQNTSPGEGVTSIPATFLRVSVAA
jgi:hypothetical protein